MIRGTGAGRMVVDSWGVTGCVWVVLLDGEGGHRAVRRGVVARQGRVRQEMVTVEVRPRSWKMWVRRDRERVMDGDPAMAVEKRF
ncbi:unnamed protein product [Sphenostylis stenocarpa]|uniref:Uncharacterized protein n=1 Tax=Sphenostylis stenocarpa TaxID=92480 RepID=A0AA86VM00_9FABA|nr:unnamed protein product [Sphenostylis stenocarpa]